MVSMTLRASVSPIKLLLKISFLVLLILIVLPTKEVQAARWKTVSAGINHTVALKGDGTLWAWGQNYRGQLGDGTTTDRLSPAQIGTDAYWQTVVASGEHTVALKDDGTLWSWGFNFFGQLGDGTTINRSLPVQIGAATNWHSVSAGSRHTVAIQGDGTLWAWGDNSNGQLGDGTTTNRSLPVKIGTYPTWESASAGSNHSVAIQGDGTLWAWGYNSNGQLGDGTTTNKSLPVQIGTATNWQTVSAGYYYTVAIKSNGTLWAWGNNSNGQLGDGTTISRSLPAQIGTATNWQSVSAGNNHILAIKSDGTLWAWGYNSNGQLGDETTTNKSLPVQIGTATNWQSVSTGSGHTVAIKSDGTLWAWGTSYFNSVTSTQIKSPVQIGTDINWQSVSAGRVHTMMIKSNGTLWTWGASDYGHPLYGGSPGIYVTPVQIGTDTNWQLVSTKYDYNEAIKSDGTILGWGQDNTYGQIGLVNTTNWKSVVAGYYHTLAIKSDGTLWTWGWNGTGQLGDGTTTNSSVPILAANLPTCTIDFPINMPKCLQGGKNSTIIGSSFADPSLIISLVEISLDNGLTWQIATGAASWSWSGILPTNGIFMARATDSYGRKSANYSVPISTGVVFYLKGTDTPMGAYGTYTLAMLNWSGSPVSALAVDIANASGTNYQIAKTQCPTALAQLGKSLGANYLTGTTTLRLNIIGANLTAIPDGDIAYLFTSVGANQLSPAVYTTYSMPFVLSPSSTTPAGALIPSTGIPNTFTAKLLADANVNNAVDIAEVQRTVNQLLQIQPVTASVDVNGDGIVTIGDLQLAINANLGALQQVSSNAPPSATLAADLNFNPSKTTLRSGETITIPITLTNNSSTGIAATSTHIFFDPSVFAVTSVTTGLSAANAVKSADYNVPKPGELFVAVYGVNTNPIADGTLANVTFRVLPTAISGTYSFGHYPLSPSVADTNGNLYQVNSIVNTFQVTDKLDGVCGSANAGIFATAPITNLCSSGTASAVTDTGAWTWNCNGINGGNAVTCSALQLREAVLNLVFAGTGGGSVSGDMSCASGAAFWSQAFIKGATINLSATANAISTFSGWSGACNTTSVNCSLTMDSSKTLAATFTKAPKAKIGVTGYDSLADAYAGAASTATIFALDSEVSDIGLTMGLGKTITIKGGYKADYSGKSGLPTLIKGALRFRNGRLTVERLVVK